MAEKEILFVCKNCGYKVEPLLYGVRNHCPKCLYSIHTDIFPNDNANPCHGLMEPKATLYNEDEEQLVLHKCISCGKTSRSVVVIDDNYEKIIDILPQQTEEVKADDKDKE